MSSAYPSDPPASRTWWSLGLKHSSQHRFQRQLSGRSSHSSGFNSIAVALGLKSKKHPVLAIQDLEYPSPRPAVPTIVTTSNRPSSKSASSTRSQVDSLGPRTPQDPQRIDRQSMLTISDSDPFAVVRAVSSAPHSPSEPSRLSLFSNSSNPDVISKNNGPIINRVSYASSSSQSNANGSDFSPLTPAIPDSNKKPKFRKYSLHRKQSLMSGDQSLGSALESLTIADKSNVGSSTTSTLDNNRLSQPEATPAPRPPIRARGMTDSGQRPNFLWGQSKTLTVSSSHMPSGPSPRAVIRQPSVSRIGLPPSAPPQQELPPPPSVKDHRPKDDGLEYVAPVTTGSASSSTLSFASSTSSREDILFGQHYNPRKKGKVSLERSVSTNVRVDSVFDASHRRPPPAPHILKKAVSHQSLGRRPPPPTSTVAMPLPELPTSSKAPRKQRSFHPSFPLPPLSPIRSSTSSGSHSSTPVTDSQSNTEQRRGSAGGFSLPVRRRIFSSGSNSRRPSTSPSTVPEDDSQSVFSVHSVPDQNIRTAIFKHLGPPLSPNPNSSFWDEVSLPDQIPSSPRTVTHEYMPQQIMSPAEMAKLEASVNDSSISDPSSSNRRREFPVLSASTAASTVSGGGLGTSAGGSSSTDVMSSHVTTAQPLTRSVSLVQKGLTAPPRLGVRPSTSQLSMATSTVSERSFTVSSPPSPSMFSLPPPPRRMRPRATFVDDDLNSPSLPPPPCRRNVRPKIPVEKVLHRRSIMRKPSFLEIDDDSDDTSVESFGEPPSGSFLDLARESFDTTRNISE